MESDVLIDERNAQQVRAWVPGPGPAAAFVQTVRKWICVFKAVKVAYWSAAGPLEYITSESEIRTYIVLADFLFSGQTLID